VSNKSAEIGWLPQSEMARRGRVGYFWPMPTPRHFSCALITGASAGLGAEFAYQLAPRVDRLVLVARRENLLQQLADEIRLRFPKVAVAVFVADLTKSDQRTSLVEQLRETGFLPDLLVNNAGMGDYGEFSSSDWPKTEAMLRLNIEALTHLTHALVQPMIRRGGGAILNVSSLASLLPIPDFAVYAASKSYVTSFSEALRIELRDHDIPVLALCPGPVHTEFGQQARRAPGCTEMSARESFYVPKEQVVAEALVALDRGCARVFPGWKTAAAAVVLGALPILAIRFIMGFRPRKI
jgi:short-subunit dehydrogenase